MILSGLHLAGFSLAIHTHARRGMVHSIVLALMLAK